MKKVQGEKYDRVLMSGDFCNLSAEDAKDKHKIKEFDEHVSKVLKQLTEGLNV